MQLKDSVRLPGLQSQILVAMIVAEGVYRSLGKELVITSANDSKHRVANSLHFQGLAVDLRTKDLTAVEQGKALALIRASLNVEYDVLLEADHIHVEYQPKGQSGKPVS